ncbi:DUF4247 domain-containing protein [Streptomyces gobiensis]|uniref:DUF4247 domain-containing protein n=1 Tax=Streptomyces gobiensis TaxID=2875706 RepID=UPI001E29CC76|nr:DUF4247 domain-containing protein [Streptomyces gobiensis]UGY93928.1 DUF4247 domain-containing protein [Streptomyces gobiensis]
MNAIRKTRLLVAPALAALLVTACGNSYNSVPRDWISKKYPSSGFREYRADNQPPYSVADAINSHSKARDRISRGGKVFLRYRDDIVAVSPHVSLQGTGSRIEIESYSRGYQRWRSDVGRQWPSSNNSGGGFRGGGPGSGK